MVESDEEAVDGISFLVNARLQEKIKEKGERKKCF